MILLPIPKQCEEKEGSLTLASKFGVNCESARVSKYLYSFIEVGEEKENTQIVFSLNSDFECEEYELKVTEESISISGGDEEALFRGAQTLKQIILQAEEGKISCLEIKDDKPLYAQSTPHTVHPASLKKPVCLHRPAPVFFR